MSNNKKYIGFDLCYPIGEINQTQQIQQGQQEKILNSTCHVCDYALQWRRMEVIMLNPCEHLVHKACYRQQKKKNICVICNTFVSSITRLGDIDNNNYQKCVDILSMSNFDVNVKVKPKNVFKNAPDLFCEIFKIMFAKGFDEGWQICKKLLTLGNIKMKINGMEKIKKEPKIFIANHTCHIDFLIIFYLFKTGFLSTSTIKNNSFTKQISEIIPILTIRFGKKSNTVEKMKEYVKKFGSICLFPEGMFTHPLTIAKFRTGAFNVGYPVYPIVIKYKNKLSDTSLLDFIFKITSDVGDFAEVFVLDPYYPPFDDVKIETIRKDMADKGNMMLSRVSNKDVVVKSIK